MQKAKDLRILDEDELEGKLRELKETLFNLRFQHATGQLDNPMKIREARRDIARVCTVMTEREYSINIEAAPAAAPEEPQQAVADRAELEAQIEAEEEIEEEVAEERIGVVEESEEQLEEEIEEELRDI